MTITLAKGFTGSCLLSRASWGVLATRGSPLVERLGRLVRGKYSPGRVGRTPPVARVYLVSPNCFSFPGARCWGRVIGCPGGKSRRECERDPTIVASAGGSSSKDFVWSLRVGESRCGAHHPGLQVRQIVGRDRYQGRECAEDCYKLCASALSDSKQNILTSRLCGWPAPAQGANSAAT